MIVVTFNYRLGVLGFLAGQELLGKGSTNPGLLDQAALFNRVKKYMKAFGGDPNSVTAFGESAGELPKFTLHIVYFMALIC